MKAPESLLEAIQYYADTDRCIGFVASMRWPDGAVCPTCGRSDVSYLANQNRWQCKSAHSKRQFSAKTGTIFEDSAIGLDKWLPAVWIVINSKNGVSSYEMARTLNTTQKTAWFMNQRIRAAMNSGNFEKFTDNVEIDETFPGGKSKNMHKGKFTAKGRGPVGKPTVFGMLARGGKVKTMIVPDRYQKTLQPVIKEHVVLGATVYTDAFAGYQGLETSYNHYVIDHKKAFVKGNIHTNSIEGFWSLFKRSYKGTYIHMSRQHLSRYLIEHTYRYNSRTVSDSQRFKDWFGGCDNRLTYKQLVG